MRRVVVVSVACVVALVLAACSGDTKTAGQTVDATYTKFDGTQGSVRDFRGRPVVINFFSSTCPPCVNEMPALEQIHRAAGDAVTFLGLDVQDTQAAGSAFLQSVGVTWNLGRDPDAAILQSLGGTVMPTTVLLDAGGKVVYQHQGALNEDDLRHQLRDHGFTT